MRVANFSTDYQDILTGGVAAGVTSLASNIYYAVASNFPSYGSNATSISANNAGGSAAFVSRSDHAHQGIATVTSSSSNTLDRPTLNLRPGNNIAFALSDSDGSGSFDTLTLSSTGGGGGGGGGSGTSFPGSPATNERFFRTDLGLEFYYDGSRWVSMTLYRATPVHAGSMPWAAAAAAYWRDWDGGAYDLWLDSVECLTYHSGAPMSSHYWTVTIYKGTAAESESSLGSFTTSSDTSANWANHKVSIGATLGSTYRYVRWASAKTNSPGNLYNVAVLNYRVIAT